MHRHFGGTFARITMDLIFHEFGPLAPPCGFPDLMFVGAHLCLQRTGPGRNANRVTNPFSTVSF